MPLKAAADTTEQRNERAQDQHDRREERADHHLRGDDLQGDLDDSHKGHVDVDNYDPTRAHRIGSLLGRPRDERVRQAHTSTTFASLPQSDLRESSRTPLF